MPPPRLARLIRPLHPRDPTEDHRVASPLELFTDLCFVVAVAQASASLHHAISAGHPVDGGAHFVLAFFGLFWAWLNFTWFASAYDNDDLLYRLLSLLQILGVLIYAAGIPRMFEDDFDLAVIGYVVMRIALVTQWLRVARHDPERHSTALRYALGVTLVQVGWICFLLVPDSLIYPVFAILVVGEIAVPAWAERPAMTPWHPHHIAERYSLFFIIVLGETVLSSTLAIQTAVDAGLAAKLAIIIIGGVPLVFSLWWLYFSREDADLLVEQNIALDMVWGFGHYFVFSSAAAIGAGLAARVDYYVDASEASGLVTAAAVTVPTAVLLLAIYGFHLAQHDSSRRSLFWFVAATVVVLAGTFTAVPELVAGFTCAALVAVTVILSPEAAKPSPEPLH